MSKRIDKLFDEVANLYPDKDAIVDSDSHISYRELKKLSDNIAGNLINSGVSAGDIIGISLHRSLNYIAAMLGIIKSGAAYLPLITRQNITRTKFILKDAQPKFVITDDEKFEITSSEILNINSLITETPQQNIESSDSDLIYVMYTSGSTGQPKGVMIEHRNVFAFLSAFENITGNGQQQRGITICPFTFDVSVWEIFSMLCYGGTLFIPDEKEILDEKYLAGFISENKITNLYIPPSLIEKLNHELKSIHVDYLKRILVGVEPIIQSTLQNLKDSNPEVRIINGYGPTETTVCASFFVFTKATNPKAITPIGKAITGDEIFLLDENLNKVEQGQKGQICISGDTVGRGYLNNPELTNKKFITNPFDKTKRMYLSGDYGYENEDGDLVFAGREDGQVKIRGYRVEVGEVEYNIKSIESVIDAVVIVTKEDDSNILNAFIVSKELDEIEVRKKLSAILPEYMIPTGIFFVDSIPTSAEGKIDRAKLLSVFESGMEVNKSKEEFSEVEEKVYSIFSEVLRRKDIKSTSNFFELGGNSLSATRVIARVNKLFRLQLPIKTIYTSPDIHSLSKVINSSEKITDSGDDLHSNYREEYPLSVNQQRPWIIFKYDKTNTIYNIQNVFKISGKVNPPQLKNALNKIVLRHDALRTEFYETDSTPMQRVLKEVNYEMEIVNCGDEEKLNSTILEVSKKDNNPFDLNAAPLFRFSCVTHENEVYLLFTIHHIIADGWSIGIFVDNLIELLTNKTSDESDVMPYQYRDYVSYQEKLTQTDRFKNDSNYLLKELKETPTYLNFPTDYIRKNGQTFKGDYISFGIQGDLLQCIKEFCRRKKISLYMFYYSCFSCLIHRYSNSNNFILGSIIAGRDRQEFENIFGFLSNTMILKNEITENETIETHLEKVREMSLEMYQYQNIPTDILAEKLSPERDLSYNPVFQIAFNYQNMLLQSFEQSELNVESKFMNSGSSMLDLTLTIREFGDAVSGSIEYSTDLFDKETIDNLTSNYLELVKSFVEGQDKKLCKVKIQSNQEIENIQRYSKSDFVLNDFKSVSEIIEDKFAKHPDKIAIESIEKSLSYLELKELIEKVSSWMGKRNIRDQKILICMSRSVELISAILGTLRSGNAYVPIDPEYMIQRIGNILDGTNPALIICDDESLTLFEKYKNKIVSFAEIINEKEIIHSQSYPESHTIAYVMFTSGTTGEPKGVEIKNESLSLFVSAAVKNYNVTSDDKVLQFSSVGFDISIEEIFVTLAAGATLVLRNDEMIYSHRKFIDFISGFRISVISLPTTFWHELVYAIKNDRVSLPTSLRLIIIGGEVLNANVVKLWFEEFENPPTLINTYGPTEATVVAAFQEVTKNYSENIPIGKPFGAAELFIYDEFGNPGIIGIPGELYISGDILSAGYLNDEKQNHDRFKIINGKRFFLTGDICKLSFDGKFYFVERKDRQVKVRGFRVEPEEIERVMMSNESVKDCVVVPYNESNGDTSLRMYCVSKLAEVELNKYLEQKLSSFMIPAEIIKVETIPRNENGKVLYDQLVIISPKKNTTEIFDKPDSDIERILYNIWKNVLNIEEFSTTESFFSLGGNSLKAIRLMALINAEFKRDIPLAELFRNSTLRQMAFVLSSDVPHVSNGVIVPMKTTGTKLPLYCIHGVGGNVLEFEPLTRVVNADQPVYGIQSSGLDKKNQPAVSIEEMAERYVNEIISHNPKGPYLLCGSSLGGWIGFEMVNKFREKGREVVFLGMFDTIAFRFHADKNFMNRFVLRTWFSIKRILYNVKVFIVAPLKIKKSNFKRILKTTRRRIKYFIWKSKISKYQVTDEKLPEYLIEVENANAKAAESYVIKPKDVTIELFRAENKTFYIEDFEYLGWNGLARRGINIHDVPGDHNSILKYPNVKVLAKKLEERLNEINEKNS